jgi:hypothetical protein
MNVAAQPAKVTLHFTVTADDNMLTAVCDELPGLVTCAEKIDRLMVPMIRDAIIGWFDTLKKRGHLDEVLGDLGVAPGAETISFAPVLKGSGEEIEYALTA